MKSRAAIGGHPIHPFLVTVPIGAFILAVIGDCAYYQTQSESWYELSRVAILVGVVSALVAALAGFADYFGVQMSARGRRLATLHMALNLTVVALFAASLALRWNGGALTGSRWTLAMGLALVATALLLASGWLGGKMVFEHKIGVIENADPEATEIGRREPAP